MVEPGLDNGSLLMVGASYELGDPGPVTTSNRWDPDRLGGEVEADEGLEGQEPKWNEYDNDEWQKKAQALGRFVNAARVVILRNRCQRRINLIKVALPPVCPAFFRGVCLHRTCGTRQRLRNLPVFPPPFLVLA